MDDKNPLSENLDTDAANLDAGETVKMAGLENLQLANEESIRNDEAKQASLSAEMSQASNNPGSEGSIAPPNDPVGISNPPSTSSNVNNPPAAPPPVQQTPEIKNITSAPASTSTGNARESQMSPNLSGLSDDRIAKSGIGILDLQTIKKIKVNVQAILGGLSMSVSELSALEEGGLISLEKNVGDEIEILANGQLIGYGEIVVIEDENPKFGITITNIVGSSERNQAR